MIDWTKIESESRRSQNSVFLQKARIEQCAQEFYDRSRRGGKLIWVGNGGSAAECQHMSAEYMVRYKLNRRPLASIALTADTSLITAHANDFEYETIFSRQIQALACDKDVLIAISTSGRSENWHRSIIQAREMGLCIVVLTGPKIDIDKKLFDYIFCVESNSTARIQEGHTLINHLICELVEMKISQETKQ